MRTIKKLLMTEIKKQTGQKEMLMKKSASN